MYAPADVHLPHYAVPFFPMDEDLERERLERAERARVERQARQARLAEQQRQALEVVHEEEAQWRLPSPSALTKLVEAMLGPGRSCSPSAEAWGEGVGIQFQAAAGSQPTLLPLDVKGMDQTAFSFLVDSLVHFGNTLPRSLQDRGH